MIRILHFVSSINVNNGVMVLLMNYYRNIGTDLIQFDFVYFIKNNIKNYEKEIQSKGGICFFVAAPNNTPLKFEKEIHLLYEKLQNKYYAIHIHDIFMPFFLMDCRQKLGVKKIIVHAHLTVYGYSVVKSIRNRIFSFPKYLIADEYWACSKIAGEMLFGKNRFYKKGMVLNNAISLEKFLYCEDLRIKTRKELGIENNFVIGHVGWFNPQKNHEFLINVFEMIKKELPEAKLILIGDGLGRPIIEDICKKKNILKDVIFLGVRNDVYKLMHLFDVFCFPSKYEGLGIALIEAQALGIPCVYSDKVPDEANVIYQQNTILSLNDSLENWKRAIIEAKRKVYNTHEQLLISGFDIKEESKKIVSYYLREKI